MWGTDGWEGRKVNGRAAWRRATLPSSYRALLAQKQELLSLPEVFSGS